MRRNSLWLLGFVLVPLCSATGQDNSCTASLDDLLPSSRGLAVAAALFLNASQQAHNSLPNPGAAYTWLVPTDAAFNTTSGSRAQVATNLKKGLPNDGYLSWLLYTLLPMSVSSGQLGMTSNSTTKLAVALNSSSFDVFFSPPNLLLGAPVTMTDGLSGGIKVLASYPVCESWVFVLDTVPWPLQNTSASGLPLVPSSAQGTTHLWGSGVMPINLDSGNVSQSLAQGAGDILSTVTGIAGNLSSLLNPDPSDLVGTLSSVFGSTPPQQGPPAAPAAEPAAPTPALTPATIPAPVEAPLPVSSQDTISSSPVTSGHGAHSSNLGAIVGGVVGGVVAVAGLAGLLCARRRHRRRRRYARGLADEEKQVGPAHVNPTYEAFPGPPPGLNPAVSGSRPLATSEAMAPQDSASSVPTSHNATTTYRTGNTADVQLAQNHRHRKTWSEIGGDGWRLEADEIAICTDEHGREVMLGQGGFGTVYKGELHHATPIAIKLLKGTGQKEKEQFLNEISILKTLHHSNIVQFMGACALRGQVALVTEYLPAGDLWHALAADSHRVLAFYRRGRDVAMDIARGTIYMHSKKIIHLDLKSANILLARDGTAKIADVGLAKMLTREMTQVSARGSFDWVAPEVLSGQETSNKADCWSLGVVLWELFSGERPNNRYLRPLRVPEECPREVNDMINRCRDMDPDERPSAKEVYDLLNACKQVGAPPGYLAPTEATSIEPRFSKVSGPFSPDGHGDSAHGFSSHFSSRASQDVSSSEPGHSVEWQRAVQTIPAHPQRSAVDNGGARAMEAWERDKPAIQQRANPAAPRPAEEEAPRAPAKKLSPFAMAAKMLAPLSARFNSSNTPQPSQAQRT